MRNADLRLYELTYQNSFDMPISPSHSYLAVHNELGRLHITHRIQGLLEPGTSIGKYLRTSGLNLLP